MKLCADRPELWLTVGYMKLCVDTALNCGWRLHEAVCRQTWTVADSWLHEAVCIQGPTVCSYIVTVLYCKPLYSSRAATVTNIGKTFWSNFVANSLSLWTFPSGREYYGLCIYITISSWPIGPFFRWCLSSISTAVCSMSSCYKLYIHTCWFLPTFLSQFA